MTNSVTQRYEELVARGEVQHDQAQLAVAAALDDVASDLTAQEGGLTAFFRRRLGRTRAVKGLYVWGEVGRGKGREPPSAHQAEKAVARCQRGGRGEQTREGRRV